MTFICQHGDQLTNLYSAQHNRAGKISVWRKNMEWYAFHISPLKLIFRTVIVTSTPQDSTPFHKTPLHYKDSTPLRSGFLSQAPFGPLTQHIDQCSKAFLSRLGKHVLLRFLSEKCINFRFFDLDVSFPRSVQSAFNSVGFTIWIRKRCII
jgi:hypothetical protein